MMNVRFVKDMLGNEIAVSDSPKRIISLVPSQTELLFDLGLDYEVIGITKFCIHPVQWFQSKTRIGGTKNIHIEKIKSLNPDLIIANKEENVKEQIEELRSFAPVWVSNVTNLKEAKSMIVNIGDLVNKKSESKVLLQKIEDGFKILNRALSSSETALYLIWNNPYMCAGKDTFIDNMMAISGFKNVVQTSRYPTLTNEQINDLNPDNVLLSSEPYPFKELHIKELQKILPNANIRLVDGEMFSWYGSRLQYSPDYFKSLFL